MFIIAGTPDLAPLAVHTCMNEGYLDPQSTIWSLHWVSEQLSVSVLKSHLCEFYFIPPHKAVLHIVEDSKADAAGLRSLEKHGNKTLTVAGFTTGIRVSIEQRSSPKKDIELAGESEDDTFKEETAVWEHSGPTRTDTQELRRKLNSHSPLDKLRLRISPIVRTYRAYKELMATHFGPG